MSECSVIGQPTGCYWLLKIVPFHSGFHPYPIIAVAAAGTTAADDASVVTVGDCDDVDDTTEVQLAAATVMMW